MKIYFTHPTQVRFRQDAETMEDNCADWFTGIAYKNEIICNCCGCIFKVDECEKVVPLPWHNLLRKKKGAH